jgi:hypothetical protein
MGKEQTPSRGRTRGQLAMRAPVLQGACAAALARLICGSKIGRQGRVSLLMPRASHNTKLHISRAIFLTLAAFLGFSLAGCTSGSGKFIDNGFGNVSSGSGGATGVITVPPAGVMVTVAPKAISLAPSAQHSFAVTVTGTTNTAVEWSVNGIVGGNSTVGTISSNGTYTAPSVAPVPDTVVITATSQQDSSKSDSAIAVITTPSTTVTVSASPASITLQTGASTAFTASVTGTANTAVAWRVNGIPGGNAAVGTITAAGIYTAPASVPTPATVTVEAVSVADPTAIGSALVTIVQRVAVSVSPSLATVGTFLTQQFTATVTGSSNPSVTWSVNGVPGGNAAVGTVDATGQYTAPASVPTPNTVTITATSVADPAAFSSATISIVNSVGVTVNVAPNNSTLNVNQTLLLTATTTGTFRGITPSPNATWFAGGLPGGDPATVGTIVPVACPVPTANTSCALYTAPSGVPTPSLVTIAARNITDPSAVGTAFVQITAPTAVTVSVSPATASVQVSTQQQFTAAVSGTTNQGVTWTATAGAITGGGLYTAPGAVPPGGTAMVCAASVVDPTASNCATVTILAAAPPPTITIAPTTASLRVNGQLMFFPTISGSSTTTVAWRVNGIAGGNATVGTITSGGLYTAPAGVPSPATVSVTGAISDPNCGAPGAMCTSAAASVTILPQASITISPSTVTVQTGNGVQFTAVVTGHTNTSVVYLVNGVPGGNSSLGTITTAGLYVAPSAVPSPNPVVVTARSVADPSLTADALVTVVVPVTVSVAPPTATIGLAATQQYTATVTGTANTAVTWRVNGVLGGNATVGTISAAGLYTAPANLILSQSFTISATSVADPTASGNATVNVNVPVAVTVAPTSASLQVGATQQFNSTVTGTTNSSVTWSVNGIAGGNATVGTVSAAGLYTAPASVPATNPVAVRATSVADPTKFAEATVTITPGVAVSIAPTSASITRGATQQFTATVTGTATTTVTWRVNGVLGGDSTVGTISAAGLYTAPTSLATTQNFTVTATSTVDPTAVATATVTVTVPITVTVSPSSQNVVAGMQQQFTATVSGTANQSVTWSVGGACTPNCGTIGLTTGLYTAPATVPAGPVTVTAASAVNPASTGTATVTVTANVAVSVSPSTATLTTGATQTFVATVTGTPTTTVTWSVNGVPGGNATVGTITAGGVYTAPAAVPSGPVTVTAASTVDPTSTGSATVTVVPPISVTVAPTPVTLQTNQTQVFTATVAGTANQAVTWSLSGASCAGAACGTITQTGNYTAPSSAPASTVTVTATSQADPTKSGTATVTVNAPAPLPANVFVTVFPRGKLLPIGITQQFTAHVIRAADQSVTWAVNGIVGGNSTVGTIDATGLYSPPSVRPTNPDITITATSVADPTKSMTVNARIIPRVTITPASAKVRVGASQTRQFTASVAGTSNTAVTWEVNGVPGGNSSVGTISSSGLYTPPTSFTPPAQFTVSATSAADPNAVGVATVGILGGAIRITPQTVTVQPGAPLVYEFMNHLLPPISTPGPLWTWRVNGVTGGTAATGTVSQAGVFRAPLTAQTSTVQAVSTVDATRTSSSTVTVAVPTGSSQVGLLRSIHKVRPYDVVAVANSISVPAPGNGYASFQVIVEGRNEDLTGVNVTVSNFTDALGNTIPSSNATIYLQKFINAFYPSRDQADIGEWPDALIPKVDPFVGETRNAFPFTVNRISPVYKSYPRSGADTSNSNLGAGRVSVSGTYTGNALKHFLIRIEQNGSVGSARFGWSNDGGATFQATNMLTAGTPIPLSDGVSITFHAGGIAGVTDFIANNEFWIFASPLRTQPVYVDVYVPSSVPAGIYSGTVTVIRSGKPNVTLTAQIDVKSFVLPLTASVPAYAGMNWAHLTQAHFLTATGSQTMSLGHLYGMACLINRISCDTASAFPPTFTFNANGEVTSASYTSYDQATAPLANGSITPHGEQLSVIRLPRAGATPSEQFFATDNLLNAFGTRGWRPRAFDFSFDEPATPQDFRAAMSRTSLVRSVDQNLRALVTSDISQFGSNLRGYVNRWSPDWTTLDKKEWLDGGNTSSRAFYEEAIAGGDELWWYGSCLAHSCSGSGATPRFDNLPTTTFDVPGLQNRVWGLIGAGPHQVKGLLLQDSILAYSRFFNMSQPRVDVWTSTYYRGGNGEGTLFYPGRPADIGGTTHIPIESLRLKHIRDALVDLEIVRHLRNRGAGDAILAEAEITNGINLNLYTTRPEESDFITTTTNLITLAGSAPAPPPINVPAAGGCYIDPVTGNRVCRVTDRAVCPNGAFHFYSYWPVWNANSSHLIVDCGGFQGQVSTALLVRNSDLAVLGNAMQGANPGPNSTQQLFWSWTDPNLLFYVNGAAVYGWNPFTRTGGQIANFQGVMAGGVSTTSIRLAYVSFDDRYLLVELYGSGGQFGLATFDRMAAPGSQIRTLDTRSIYSFFDEAVLTKDNHVWVVGDEGGTQSFSSRRYTIDFSSFIRVSDHGHHAHGILNVGPALNVPIALKAASNRDCPPGSAAGVPGSGWRPTAQMLDERVATPSTSTDPFPGEVLRLGCAIPGQHDFAHFSWNNTHTDRFFVSMETYSAPGTDPLANTIARVNIIHAAGRFQDLWTIVIPHRSNKNLGYYALPRASCNVQGTRCLFSSSMTVQTNKTTNDIDLYVVDVP